VALVQFSGDRGNRIVTLDRQWDSLEEIRSLTRISRDVGQSAAQLRKECDAGLLMGPRVSKASVIIIIIIILLLLFFFTVGSKDPEG